MPQAVAMVNDSGSESDGPVNQIEDNSTVYEADADGSSSAPYSVANSSTSAFYSWTVSVHPDETPKKRSSTASRGKCYPPNSKSVRQALHSR